MEIGKVINYDINIRPTANKGFTAEVGCGRFAFTSKRDLLAALEDYLNDPKKFEKEYNNISGGPLTEVARDETPPPPRPTPACDTGEDGCETRG